MEKILEKEDFADYNIYKLMRIARNKSAKKLSEDIGVSPAYIHAIESGERQLSDKIKKSYLEALNIDEEILDTFSKQSKKYNSYERLLMNLLKLIIKSDPEL